MFTGNLCAKDFAGNQNGERFIVIVDEVIVDLYLPPPTILI